MFRGAHDSLVPIGDSSRAWSLHPLGRTMSQAAPHSPECLMEPIPGVLSGGHRFWADFGVSPHAGYPAGTYDRRSWLVSAAELGSSRTIASVRLTSRSEGPLKIEEHFGLPRQLRGPRTAEIADFAMANRSPTDFAPLILGLFGVVTRVLARLDAIYAVVCSPSRTDHCVRMARCSTHRFDDAPPFIWLVSGATGRQNVSFDLGRARSGGVPTLRRNPRDTFAILSGFARWLLETQPVPP